METTDIILQTDRLYLTRWTRADKPVLLAILGDADVTRFIADGLPFTEKQVDDFIEWAAVYERENGFSRWKIIETATGDVIGSCGFARPHETPEPEIGYLLAKRHWNRGFASEIAAATVEYGFRTLCFTQIIALAAPENLASQRVLEKIGFARRGIEITGGDLSIVYYKNATDPTPAGNAQRDPSAPNSRG